VGYQRRAWSGGRSRPMAHEQYPTSRCRRHQSKTLYPAPDQHSQRCPTCDSRRSMSSNYTSLPFGTSRTPHLLVVISFYECITYLSTDQYIRGVGLPLSSLSRNHHHVTVPMARAGAGRDKMSSKHHRPFEILNYATIRHIPTRIIVIVRKHGLPNPPRGLMLRATAINVHQTTHGHAQATRPPPPTANDQAARRQH